MGNVKTKEGFSQVCVWPGTVVGKDAIKEFEKFIKDECDTEIQYLEEIETFPDKKNGKEVKGTGGRNDVFFAVKAEDISKFAVKRLAFGIRWIEDVLSSVNYHSEIYPERVKEYRTWNTEPEEKEESEEKPSCKLIGEDGNVFNIIRIISRTLKKASQKDKADEFERKAFSSKSYDEVLRLANDYVNVI